jgi:hypothetical protein
MPLSSKEALRVQVLLMQVPSLTEEGADVLACCVGLEGVEE